MRMAAWLAAVLMWSAAAQAQEVPLQVGLAEIDITPPAGYRMDGYFYERLNTGVRDPLKAKAHRVSAGDDPGGDGGVRPAGHAAVDVERGPGAGGPAHRHSGREHRDHRDPHPHRAALRRRAGAALQRAGRSEVRDRPARGGEISRDAAGPAGRGHRGGECPGLARRAGAARVRRRPGLVQPPLSSEGRHRPLQPGRAESRDRAGRRSDRSGAPVPAVHQGQETGRLVDGVRAARRHRWRDGVLRGLSGSAGRRADAASSATVSSRSSAWARAATSITSTSPGGGATTPG